MGVVPALLRCRGTTFQPDPPRLNLGCPKCYRRTLRSRTESRSKHSCQGRLPVASASAFCSREFSVVATSITCSRHSLPTVATELCSRSQQLRINRVAVLASVSLRDLICPTASTTASEAFSNNSSSSSSSAGTTPHSSDVLADQQPQLCPVCAIASTSSCLSCDQYFCGNHVYSCVECGDQYCGACLDAHHADGHWGDSDTAAELAQAQYIANEQVCCQSVLGASGLVADNGHSGRSSWTVLLATFRSLLTQMLQPEACW